MLSYRRKQRYLPKMILRRSDFDHGGLSVNAENLVADGNEIVEIPARGRAEDLRKHAAVQSLEKRSLQRDD